MLPAHWPFKTPKALKVNEAMAANPIALMFAADVIPENAGETAGTLRGFVRLVLHS